MRILIIAVANLLFFYKVLKYGYVCDDLPASLRKHDYKNIFHKIWLNFNGEARYTPKVDHTITLIVHTLVGIFIYLGFGKNDISFITALLFCFNPANNQGSIYISGRGYALGTLFLVLAYATPIIAPVFLFGCAYFISGFLSPFAFIGSDKWHLLLWMPIVWTFLFKNFFKYAKSKYKNESFAEDKRFHIGKIILALKTFGYYFILSLFPFKLAWYHSYLESAAGNPIMRKRAYKIDKFFFVGIGITTFLLYSAIWNWTPISWGVLWFAVCIAPFCNLFRLQQEIAERYCYTASVGLMYSLANIIYQYPVVITFFLTMYCVRLYNYMKVCYVDDYWLVEASVYESPGSWFGWHIRGIKRLHQGAVREALNMWVMAKLISPKEFKILFNIAVILRKLKKHDDSKHYFQLAKENIVEGQEETSKKLFEDVERGEDPLLL